jgi:hypothetical protein
VKLMYMPVLTPLFALLCAPPPPKVRMVGPRW